MSDAEYVIEMWPPKAIGGQQVGMVSSGVKVTHVPSGMVAISPEGRSQHRNRQIAMHMIEGGLTSPAYRGPMPEESL